MRAVAPSQSLRRRMNELEQALIAAVFILVVFLFITTLGWVEEDGALAKRILLPSRTGRDNVAFTKPEVSTSSSDSSAKARVQDMMSTIEKSIKEMSKPVSSAESLDESYFLPGTLNMTRTEVLHKCYFPATIKLPAGQGCSISEKYKIIFHLTPKSGSSTGRHVIKNDFNGIDHFSERACSAPQGEDQKNWYEVAVLRNPATRAFASYEEMFVRRLGNPEMIPESSRAFMEPFRGWVYKNYSALFDTIEGVRMLNDAYERFMKDWDGSAFDMHLESQVAYNMRRRPGSSRHDSDHLKFVFDTHSMEQSFQTLAEMVHLNKKPKVIKGRAYPRRLNVTNVSDQAFQAMCRRYRDDFCCLNYALPPQCLRNVPVGQRVRCKWIEPEGEAGNKLIEAVVV